MFEINVLFIAAIILLYFLKKSRRTVPGLLAKAVVRNNKHQRIKRYMERFKDHKAGKGNIIAQTLPWIAVLAVVFILSNQYIFFGTVLTGSMEPRFQRGDLVLMQTFNKDVKIGDVVIYTVRNFKEPITHRVTIISPDGSFRTKGDNNREVDQWVVNKENVIGKAVTMGMEPVVIKGLGKILVPESKDFSIMNYMPKGMGITVVFQQIRAIQPFIIFFGTIFYFFILIETRMEDTRRLRKKENINRNRKIS